VYVTDVVGCRNTGGDRRKSGPFPVKIKVENINEAPSTVNLAKSTSAPMSSSAKLLELQSSASVNPTPWSLGTDRKIGTLSYSADGDCGAPGITCFFECKNKDGVWYHGSSNKCGGPTQITFKIVGANLLLATSSQDALNYEASAQSVSVTVRTVVQDSASPIPDKWKVQGQI